MTTGIKNVPPCKKCDDTGRTANGFCGCPVGWYIRPTTVSVDSSRTYNSITPITLETIKAAMEEFERRNVRIPKYIKVKQAFLDAVIKKLPTRPVVSNDIGLGFAPMNGLRVVVDDSIVDEYEVVYEGDE